MHVDSDSIFNIKSLERTWLDLLFLIHYHVCCLFLDDVSEVMILMSVLTLNLQRRLRLLLRTFFSMYFEQQIMLFVQ